MSKSRKIATCSYCGTRAILVLDRERHELSCAACGAPLHDMKFMPQPYEGKPKNRSHPKRGRATLTSYPKETYADLRRAGGVHEHRRRKKKRSSLFRRVLEDVWDEVEDIFD